MASPSLPPTFDTGLWGGLETGKLGESRIVVARQGPFCYKEHFSTLKPESEGYKPQTDPMWCRNRPFQRRRMVPGAEAQREVKSSDANQRRLEE